MAMSFRCAIDSATVSMYWESLGGGVANGSIGNRSPIPHGPELCFLARPLNPAEAPYSGNHGSDG